MDETTKKWTEFTRKEQIEFLQNLLGAMQSRREFNAKLEALTEEAAIRALLQRAELENQLDEMNKGIKAMTDRLPEGRLIKSL